MSSLARVAWPRALLSILALFALAPAPASAAGPADLALGGNAVVHEVVDGDTVVLAEAVDGRTVARLVGIQAPKLPLDRLNYPSWPLALDAKRALEMLALGKRLTLSFGGQRADRHGRHLAHLRDDQQRWMQGEMLRQGLARVYTFADNRALAAEMYAIEAEARAARRGIWGHPYYAIRTPDTVRRDTGTFQVVEGRVADATKVKNRVFLNFGPDWRSDFTVAVVAEAVREYQKRGVDPQALKGRWLRVRGWVTNSNGPMIEATHPEQIEIVDR